MYLPVSLKKIAIFTNTYSSDTQSFLIILRILNQLEVGLFDQALKLESPCTYTG
jgi:hypothetical protein